MKLFEKFTQLDAVGNMSIQWLSNICVFMALEYSGSGFVMTTR